MIPFCSNGQQAVALARLDADGKYKQFTHYWTPNLPQFMSDYDAWLHQQNAAGFDVFYSTGAFDSVVSALSAHAGRSKDNCVAQRSLFLDIDAKDQLIPTVDACSHALIKFVSDSGIEFPSTVVRSGNGLHCYWLCDESIPLDGWQQLADTLVAAASHFGLRADIKCTSDRARVLRLPGFVNHKHGRAVEVMWPAEGPPQVYSIEQLAEMLYPHVGLAPATPARRTSSVQSLDTLFPGVDLTAAMDKSIHGDSFGVSQASWSKLRDASLRGDGCALLAQAMLDQGSVRYDLWTGVLSVAAHTDAPDQAIVDTCGQHPEFDMGMCQRKAATFDGPRRCETLQAAAVAQGMPNPCAGCRFAGKIGSPIMLGKPDFALRGEIQVVQERVVVQETRKDGTVADIVQTMAVEKRALPFPYCRVPGQPGIFQKVKEDGPSGATWVVPDHPLLREDISVVMVRDAVEGAYAKYEYVHPRQGRKQFEIPLAAFSSSRGDSWTGILANAHVDMSNAATNPIWRAEVSRFLQRVASDYTDNVKAAQTVGQFGPIEDEDETFVYGNVCYRAGGAPVEVILTEDARALADKMAQPAATPEMRSAVDVTIGKWNDGLRETIGDAYRCGPDQFILMSGFATSMAPFVIPARQRGGMIVTNSTEAGSGKTSMVARAVQMYVSGDESLVVPNATMMAFLEKKVALAGSLPVCWDEVAKGRDEKACTLLHSLALSSTDRKPRERLHGHQTNVSWQAWFYGTTNPDPHELISSVAGSANGAVARVLNVKVGKARFGSGQELMRRQAAEMQFSEWCKKNANVVGQRWIEHMMQRLPHLRERYAYWMARLVDDCPKAFEDGSLRFSGAIVAATMTATEEAGAAGLHPFSTQDVYAFALEMLNGSAERASDAVIGDDQLLPELLRSSVDVMLIKHVDGASINDRIPAKEVAIRVEVSSDATVLSVSASYAKEWCKRRGVSHDRLRGMLSELGAQSGARRLTAGTSLPSQPVRAHTFTLPKESNMDLSIPSTNKGEIK